MSVFVIAQLDVADPAAYEEYRRKAPATIAQHGGRYVARTPTPVVLEGQGINRVAVLEFPTEAHARRWYDSPEYRAILPLRQRHARGTLVLVPSLDGGPLAA